MSNQEKGERIILVDDDPVWSWIIEKELNKAGYENVVVYDDPRIALEEIKRGLRPALVISDFKMPVMNGLDMLREIETCHPKIEAIIVSTEPSLALREAHRFRVLDKTHDIGSRIVKIVKKGDYWQHQAEFVHGEMIGK